MTVGFIIKILPTTAHKPSFSRMWSDPVPKDSSPQMDRRPASIKFPKNFHPMDKIHHSMNDL